MPDDCPHGQQKRTCEICELVAERDDLQESYVELVHKHVAVEAERDRLRAVVEAVREFAAADTAWHAKIERGENVRSTDDESRRRAGAILVLLETVRQLDGSADMGGRTVIERSCPYCGGVIVDEVPMSAVIGGSPTDSHAGQPRVVVPGTPQYSRVAIRAHQAGVPVSLNHDTGEWTIPLRAIRERRGSVDDVMSVDDDAPLDTTDGE